MEKAGYFAADLFLSSTALINQEDFLIAQRFYTCFYVFSA